MADEDDVENKSKKSKHSSQEDLKAKSVENSVKSDHDLVKNQHDDSGSDGEKSSDGSSEGSEKSSLKRNKKTKKKIKEFSEHVKEKEGKMKFGDDNIEDERDVKKNVPKRFNANDYQKPTSVVFHTTNDLADNAGVGFDPQDAIPKHGPGVTKEIEQLYGTCTLLSDFQYTTWANTVVPLKNHNIVQGFNEMALHLMRLAASGGENMSHEEAFLAVSFLSNIRNDLGEYPPNILSLMEHTDYLTRGSANPKFISLTPCGMKKTQPS